MGWVPLGVIVRPHGVRGELQVRLHHEASDLLGKLDEIVLRRDGSERTVRIASARRATKGMLVRLEGVDDREAADALRGSELGVPRDRLPRLRDDEVYLADLVGLPARLGDADVGIVEGIAVYPTVTCLRVKTGEGVLEVPLLPRWVDLLDVDHGCVRLCSIDDLAPGR